MNYMFTKSLNKIIVSAALLILFCSVCYETRVYGQDNINAYFEEDYEGSSNYYRTQTRTKKGLQEAFAYSGVYKDLGISHTLINVCLNQLLNGNIRHVYNGKTYYFNEIPDLPVQAAMDFNENDVGITLVLLMQMDERSIGSNLIYPGALGVTNKRYYAWNVNDPAAVETLSALMDFLASTYGRENCHIDNWIVGNEVNMPNAWNYTGTTNLSENVEVAAKSFAIVNTAIKRYNSGAKTYLSLDHSWAHNDEGRGIAGKTFLDAFAARIVAIEPGIDWNIAYHPYAPIMTESNIWNSRNSTHYTPVSLNADFISARNLNVFTDYVKSNFGSDVRIILSEQGFTMYGGQEERQAAALAYTYYAAEFNDMVDATMFRSLNDATVEMADRFYFGLLNSDGSKRPAYDVFKYMDTEEWESYTRRCLNTIGISLWNELVTYFDGSRFVRLPLESISLEKDGTVLAVGHKETLQYEVYPEFASTKDIIWISDDESIVTIDAKSGEMTAVAPGRTIVMAASGDIDYATCIVVVKDEEESRLNIEKFVDEMYMAVRMSSPSQTDLDSYTQRLMSKNITAAQMAYEIISGKESTHPSESNEAYVRMVYKAILGFDDNDDIEKEVQMYTLCLEAGMSKYRVFADLIARYEFDYRCYDADIVTGKLSDISPLSKLNMTSYNRKSEITYFVTKVLHSLLDRYPNETELTGLCSKLIGKRITRTQLLETILQSEEYKDENITNQEYVDLLYEFSDMEPNAVTRQAWVAILNGGMATRIQLVNDFIK